MTLPDIGALGEALLETWCHNVGISPTKTSHDRTGWDYFLVLPRPDCEKDVLLDRRSAQITCLVQVKTTTTSTRRTSLKLSNMERLARWPTPAFVLLVHLDETSRSVSNAWLVHIDRALVSHTLRQLRLLSGESVPNVHKKLVPIRPSDSDALQIPSGKSLLERIQSDVGILEEYAIAKLRWGREAGYTKRRARGTITIAAANGKSPYEQLADFAVGISDKMQISGMELLDSRFGIDRPVRPGGTFIDSHIHSPNNQSIGTTRIVVTCASERAQLDCETRMARAVFPFLPERHNKVRLSCHGFSMVMTTRDDDGPVSCQLQFDLPSGKAPMALGTGGELGRFARLSNRAILGDGRIELELRDGSSTPLSVAGGAGLNEALLRHAILLELALTIRDAYKLGTEESVRLSRLAAQRRSVSVFAAPFTPNASICMQADISDVSNVAVAAIVVSQRLVLEGSTLVGVFAVVGAPEWGVVDGINRLSVSGNVRLMSSRIVRTPRGDAAVTQDELDAAASTLVGEGVGVVSRELLAKPRP